MKKARIRRIYELTFHGVYWDDDLPTSLGCFDSDEEVIRVQQEHIKYLHGILPPKEGGYDLEDNYTINENTFLDTNQNEMQEEVKEFYENKFRNERPDQFEFVSEFGTSYIEEARCVTIATQITGYGWNEDHNVSGLLAEGFEVVATNIIVATEFGVNPTLLITMVKK